MYSYNRTRLHNILDYRKQPSPLDHTHICNMRMWKKNTCLYFTCMYFISFPRYYNSLQRAYIFSDFVYDWWSTFTYFHFYVRKIVKTPNTDCVFYILKSLKLYIYTYNTHYTVYNIFCTFDTHFDQLGTNDVFSIGICVSIFSSERRHFLT